MTSFLLGTAVIIVITASIVLALIIRADRSQTRSMDQWHQYTDECAKNGPANMIAIRERIAAVNLVSTRIDLQAKQTEHEMRLQHAQRIADLEKKYATPKSADGRKPRVVGGSSTNEKTSVDLRRLH